MDLPILIPEDLYPTRDYIQNAAHAIGSLQRAFLPKHPRDWHYGLEVYMRGISTQPLNINGTETRGLVDFVSHKVRVGDASWSLEEYDGPELLNNIKVWLEGQGIKAKLETPEFSKGAIYKPNQAKIYAEALWWLDRQFKAIKAGFSEGVTAPVLLYPHHFDLSLVWFPWDDERQLVLGWSTGDENVREPYVYLTAYPEPRNFTDINLPDDAYWHKKGFSGAVLPYSALQSERQADKYLQDLADDVFADGRELLA